MGSQVQDQVILLGSWFSPYALRVEWALKLKGIPFQFIEEDLCNKSPLLLKLNPFTKKIPVLVHDGKPIVDSLAIVEYIDETWNHTPRLMPQDPYHKAMARFWADFIEEKLHKAIRRAKVFNGERKEKEVNEAKEALQLLDGMLNGNKKFFGGDSIGFLDIAFGWITVWLGVFEELGAVKVFESHKYPLLHIWTQNFMQHQIIKETLPSKEMLIPVLQSYGMASLTRINSNNNN